MDLERDALELIFKPAISIANSDLVNNPQMLNKNIEYVVDSFLQSHPEYVPRREYLLGTTMGIVITYYGLARRKEFKLDEVLDGIDKLIKIGIDGLKLYNEYKKIKRNESSSSG